MSDYAVIDIEATGGKAGTEKIIDIYIYRFNGHEVLDQFGSMVNPQRSIDAYVQKLTGITEKMVRRAPKFYELAKRVVEITEGAIIVGHGVDFDYRMLRQEFRELGFDFERKTLDTLDLSKKLLPDAESYSLGKLTKSLGIPVSFRHTAEGDTRITLELFKILLEKDIDKKIIQSFAIHEPKSHKQISKLIKLEENLPNQTGNFYMLNADGKMIFSAAAKNIRNDVNEIFTSNGKNEKRIQTLVHSINFEISGSFLIALLKEKEELKAHKILIPLRRKYFSYGLYANEENMDFEVEKNDVYRKQPMLLFHNKRKAYKTMQQLHKTLQLDVNESLHIKLKKINQHLKFPSSDFIITDKGRNAKEKSFIEFSKGKLMGYGFYTYYNQLENEEIRRNLLTPLKNTAEKTTLVKTFLKFHHFPKIIELNKDQSFK